MNVPSVDIKDYLLSDSSLGLTFATDLFIGTEPKEPDNCVTIYDTPGGTPEKVYSGASGYYRPSIQIRVRNNEYVTGLTLIDNIKKVLDGLGPVIINGTKYTYINCLIEPGQFPRDENDRFRFVTTFDIQRTE